MTATPTDRFAATHRKAALWAWGVALAAMLVALGLGFWLHSSRERAAPRLEGGKTPLATVLGWPWGDFPPSTAVERARIEGELELREPLFAARLLPWTEIPEAPALRPTKAETLTALGTALESVRALPDPSTDEASEDPSALEQRIDSAIDALERAKRSAAGSPGALWLLDYDRGILFLRRGNARAAARDLDAARRTIDRRIDATPAGCGRAALYEASLHTRYALGHAQMRIAAEVAKDDAASAAGVRQDGLRSLGWTLVDVYNIKDECPARYPEIASTLQVFSIGPTGLSSGALAGDLIAGYLASPGFNRCEDRPTAVTCTPLPRSRAGDCSYRDRSLCRSSLRSAPPFDRLFRQRFDRFYGGDEKAWQEENLLWALSNAIDWTAENAAVSLDDPHLLYNLGALAAQLGEFRPAANFLRQAQELSGDLPALDARRLDQLAAATAVLAGTNPRTNARARKEPSLPRAIFRKLYPEGREVIPGVRVSEFKPVGDTFQEKAEAAIDDWLFLQLWRTLLAQGNLSAFEREHARALAQKGISRDFFTAWRTEVLTALGERALARAQEIAGREPAKAKLIRRFVADDPAFPSAVAAKARGGIFGKLASLARRGWPLAIYALLALVFVAAPLWARALVRAHRNAFASAYAAGRRRAGRG